MPALVALRARTSSVDAKLLEMLVCPVTKGPLVYDRERQELDLQVGAARLSGSRRHSGDARGRGAPAHAGRVRASAPATQGESVPRGRVDARSMAGFTVLIPARYASTRLPGQAARRHRAASRWSCASPSARRRAARRASSWPPTTSGSAAAVAAHGIAACLTRADHPTGTDRLAEAARRSASTTTRSSSTCRATSRCSSPR